MTDPNNNELYRLIIDVHKLLNEHSTQVGRLAGGHGLLVEKVKRLEGDHEDLEEIVAELQKVLKVAQEGLQNTAQTLGTLQSTLSQHQQVLTQHDAPIKVVEEHLTLWRGIREWWKAIFLVILAVALLLSLVGPQTILHALKKATLGGP